MIQLLMMKKILVSGLVNIETSLHVDSFPINYSPIEYPFFGVNSCVSGVGYNVAKAIKTLGGSVELLSVVGTDLYSNLIKDTLKKEHIGSTLLTKIDETPTSIVLVDNTGRRKIYCDLKNLQDISPIEEREVNLDNCSLAVLTNINFNRQLLKVLKEKEIVIATDVHVLGDVDDDYNKDFMENADILFLSNEAIKNREEEFLKEIYERYHNKIIVCGCGDRGAVMYIGYDDKYYYEESVAPKGIKSTVGAGDALFSSFIYFYQKGLDLQQCLKNAVLFAGIKISEAGGSNGFVSEEELLK